MSDPSPRARRPRGLLVALVAILLLWTFLPLPPGWIESLYSRGLYRFVSASLVSVGDSVPFPLGGVLLIGLAVALPVLVVVSLRRSRRRGAGLDPLRAGSLGQVSLLGHRRLRAVPPDLGSELPTRIDRGATRARRGRHRRGGARVARPGAATGRRERSAGGRRAGRGASPRGRSAARCPAFSKGSTVTRPRFHAA